MKKLFMVLGALASGVLFNGTAIAGGSWGPCSTKGGPHMFSTSFNQTITEPSSNYAGKVINNFYAWNLGTTYSGMCECPDDASSHPRPTYYKGESTLPLGHNDGKQYYAINKNLDAAIRFWVVDDNNDDGGVFMNIPFNDVSNNLPAAECVATGGGTRFATGSMGDITLYITKPFVGESVIPATVISNIYGTKQPGVYSSEPMASVLLSGLVIIEQGCEIDGNTVIDIPFGEFNARDFKNRKGVLPDNGTEKRINISFDCKNISDGVKGYIRIQGNVNPHDNRAIDIGNEDVGVLIKDSNGNILVPNDPDSVTELSFDTLSGVDRNASVGLSASPVSTTGSIPAAGSYEGVATMWIDVD